MMRTNSPQCYTILLYYFTIVLFLLFLSPILVKSIDTITATQSLKNGETIVSSNDVFELGFFNPGNSKWYLGIWYKDVPGNTVVWVANRDNPITNSSDALLKISDDQKNIVILDNIVVWSLSNQTKAVSNPVAQLLDSGNFVLREETDFDSKNYLWQSFDYPTDTLLPEMKLGWDLNKGKNWYLMSWKSAVDPSSGPFSFKLDPRGFPEFFLKNDENIIYRSGPWNGLRLSGVPEMKTSTVLDFIFVTNQDEVYYSFTLKNKSTKTRLMVSSSGVLQRFIWIETSKLWKPFWYAPKDQCDYYRECGVYGICDTNGSPICKCMKGFGPKNQQAWNLRDGSDGCVRKTNLDCVKDGFLALKNMKLPETSSTFVDRTMSHEECEKMCRKNCSCTGFASSNITGEGTGCVIWNVELLDMRQYADADGGQDLYVRSAASELGGMTSDKRKLIIMVVAITVGIIGTLICGLCVHFVWKKKKNNKGMLYSICSRGNSEQKGSHERSQDLLLSGVVLPSKRDYPDESKTGEIDLPLYDFNTIAMATNNFSEENKLGQGGFGCVYKGLLSDGQEIAVKRLSKNSGQGTEEFINEVKLIARLQHRNLVRLLGCCCQMDEKMLLYEYMRHRSLDSIIFSKEKSSLLNWQTRFNIICGIARGLLYLHQDSRFRIIHRDLKASNVLLDGEMNPKISDFGMARIFGKDQTEANTLRVVGTYGYMSPEYAMDGLFSVKSDVFSFGVLLLEIVSGKKNRGFYYSNNELNLLGYAWRLWRGDRKLELMDPTAADDSISTDEVLRCIQVGLLCVQEQAEDRPTMSSVVLMLSSETATMPQPKTPGFCLGTRTHVENDSSSGKPEESCTVNQVTVTMLEAR